MKNYIQKGTTLTLVAPYNVLSGDGFKVGAIFAIAVGAALANNPVEGVTEGVFALPKTSGQAWTLGQKIYWDDTNKRCDTDGTTGMLIGVATVIAANPSAVGNVKLNEAAPGESTGPQAAIANIATADATDLTTAEALANATKAKVNALLSELRLLGILLP
jgi:predicted RecA/RadA family phage recombinase